MIKALFILVVMMSPKQTCVDAWSARQQVVYVKSSDGKLEPRMVPNQQDPKPEARYDVLVATSSAIPSVSPEVLQCFDVYSGHSRVGVRKVEAKRK